MRNFLRSLLYKPLVWVVTRFSSRPDRVKVNRALTLLLEDILKTPGKRGPIINFDTSADRFVIFSDQHKGAKDGADNFALAEPNYLAALRYYDNKGFHFISLGDNEELWENTVREIRTSHRPSIEAEMRFIGRQSFTKVFGNHDLYWSNDPFAPAQLRAMYGVGLPVYEGVMLQTHIHNQLFSIYCTHGHQGDAQSDGNWFSKFFVSRIWGPMESYLNINPNTPSCNDSLKTAHNQMMYEWSSQEHSLLLITGHTHQPVFESLTHLESLYRRLDDSKKQNELEKVKALEAEIRLQGRVASKYQEVKPTYFNSGCCCFNDGDITGIEIADGMIRLVKWDSKKTGESVRIVLEETSLENVASRTQ